jgi:hypothetical protein
MVTEETRINCMLNYKSTREAIRDGFERTIIHP